MYQDDNKKKVNSYPGKVFTTYVTDFILAECHRILLKSDNMKIQEKNKHK